MRFTQQIVRSIPILPLLLFGVSGDDPAIDTTVIAVVNGKAIKYADVKVSSDALVKRFHRKHTREPATEEDKQIMEQDRRELEMAALTTFIRGTVRQQQLERLAIEPTEQEIEERWRIERRNIDVEGDLAKSRELLSELVKAMDEVIDQGQDADAMYERRLGGKMSREAWALRLEYDATPERRALLERALALPDSELFDPHEAMRQVLIIEKQNQAIEKELVATDPEFAEYVRLAATDPRNEKVQSKGPLYRQAKRYEWWQERYREAKVEIKHERFKEVWKEPFE